MRNSQDNRIGNNQKYFKKIPHFFAKFVAPKKAGFIFGYKKVFSLFFGFIFVLYIFTGYSPIDLFNGTISALVGRSRTINLYASSGVVDNNINANKGWWNQERALGEAEVSEHATMFSFSEETSAVYSGGNFSLVLSDFMFLSSSKESFVEKEAGIQSDEEWEAPEGGADMYEDTDLTQEEIEKELENVDIGKLEIENWKLESSTDDVGDLDIGSINDINISTSTLLLEEEIDIRELIEKIKSNDISTGSSENEDQNTDTVETHGNASLHEEPNNDLVEPNDDMEVEIIDEKTSFMDKVKNFINAYNPILKMIATAQEILSPDINTLEDLGEFKSAKIKFSFAMESGVDFVKPVESGDNNQKTSTFSNVIPSDSEESREITDNASSTLQFGGRAESFTGVQGDIGDKNYSEQISSSSDSYISSNVETRPSNSAGRHGESLRDGQIEDTVFGIGEENVVEVAGEELNIIEINRNGDEPKNDEVIIDSNVEVIEAEEQDVEVEVSGPSDADGSDRMSLINKLIKVRDAQAQEGNGPVTMDAKIIVWYSVDSASGTNDRVWEKLDELSLNTLSNVINGGYFDYDAPFLDSWEKVEGLKIKFEGLVDEESIFTAFLDSVWVEAEYEPGSDIEKIDKRQRWEEALDLLSEKLVFQVGEEGVLRFRYNKNENRIWDTLGEIIGVSNFWKDINIEARLVDSSGREVGELLTFIFEEDGEFEIRLPEMKELKPGKYTIKFIITDSSGDEEEVLELKQSFSWGVLAMNFNKSVYLQDEKAYIQMAVLDDNGHTVCDASLSLKINNPNGDTITLSSFNNLITSNPACAKDNVISTPDYFAYYNLDAAGEYEITLTASTSAGAKIIMENLIVKKKLDLEVERVGPTRINPKSDYSMTLNILANTNFKGDFVESVPDGFKIKNYELKIINNNERDPFGSNYEFEEVLIDGQKKLFWRDVEFLEGDEIEIQYTFDAPDNSPEFYLLGPAHFSGISKVETSASSSGIMETIKDFIIGEKKINFTEYRNWQIASDAVSKRARTVMFMAGTYNGGATAGQNTNDNNVFNSFNFRLAETGVEIKNAFVFLETQIEAYNSTGGNYTGYKLGFDACDEFCSAFGTGNGQVLDDNSNILAYDELESNHLRLLLDVTNETDLASYTGGNTELEAQFGYNIKNGTTKTSIASARAVLYITYTYDADSSNVTNTVVYPLASTDTAPTPDDSGTMQNSVSGCTRNSTCPIYDYHMEIPEFPSYATSTYRLDSWFKMFDGNDGNNAVDLDPNVNIQGYDVDSETFHFECANGGTQGNMQYFFFPEWANSGYAENITQQLEFYINTGTNYAVGGEVYETYIASSSAATSTKTVSFPLGVINNGNTTALTFKDVDVYFPENGSGSGKVRIKKAWFRIIDHHYNNGAWTTTVSSKVGANATSSSYVYNYNGGGTVPRPTYNIVHIIPSTDYAELQGANSASPKTVRLNITQSSVTFGGISAELMITYVYDNDNSEGYLTSLNIFAGQSSEAPATSTTFSTIYSVFPENAGKTVYAGGIWAYFLNSDSAGDVAAGGYFGLDANISTGVPVCSPDYWAQPDAINSSAEIYKDVTSALDATDNQSYTTCYVSDDTALIPQTDGAKMNGILTYTYGWENTAPTSTLISAIQKIDGTGVVDIAIEVDDLDGHEVTAKLEFATGTSCVFIPSGDPTLDEADGNITADYGVPYIENDNEYQIGTVDAYIQTASGSNTVFFDWQSKADLGSVEGDYCLRLIANDLFSDQATPATTTVYIDNINPTAPEPLSLNSRTGTSLTLNFGATSTETNFKEYKIYYKVMDGTAPRETDSILASSTDENLGDILFNDEATTTITSGLVASTTYSIAIWVYDWYGNKASSSFVNITTNDAPTGIFNKATTKQRQNGSGIVDISFDADDANNHDTLKAKIEYATSSNCNFTTPLDPTLDETDANVTADFGDPDLNNNWEYQIGTSGAWILTSPGENTIEADWFSKTDEPEADGTYCLRLTVNDRFDNQLILATTTLTLDNTAPTSTGSLLQGKVTTNSITILYATTTPGQDTNEPAVDAYKIFYKQGISGVTEGGVGMTEVDNTNLNAYDYNSATSTLVTGLTQNTWYVFNIWTYDVYGNKASATEVAIKTNATISNVSLTFTNAFATSSADNIVMAGSGTGYNFRAVVTETNGWYAISSTTLRLADKSDNASPYDDLKFYWNQTTDEFYESGNDILNVATLSGNSTSSCAVNTCILDFKIIFNKNFASTSVEYSAELSSRNDIGIIDNDSYADFYQVTFPFVKQIHYRWRNNDGGE